MPRRIRYTRRNASSSAPTYHVCVTVHKKILPCSTDGSVSLLAFEGVSAQLFEHRKGQLEKRDEVNFNHAGTFWQWLYSGLHKRRKTWLWCRRAAESMMLLGLPDQLDSIPGLHHWNVWESCPFLQSCRHPNGNFLILDIRNWIKRDEKELQKAAGSEQWLSVVCKKILELRHKADLGYLRATVAAQAHGAYRHRLCETYEISEVDTLRRGQMENDNLDRCYPVPHADDEALKLEQRAYFGGLFRQYYRGRVNETVSIVDIRSAYAAAMVRTPMPSRLLGRVLAPKNRELTKLLRDYCCIAWVLLETDDYEYPTIDLRHGVTDANIDPSECWTKRGDDRGHTVTGIGRIATALAGPELLVAHERGHIRAVERLYYYEPRNLFGRYVAELWRLRQEYAAQNDAITEQLCKDLLASLWGKFGQSSPSWIDAPDVSCPVRWGLFVGTDRQTQWTGVCRAIAGKAQKRNVWRVADGAFPAIAAYVASNARVMLHELTDAAGPCNVYYSVVDCIHTNAAGLCNLRNRLHAENACPGDWRVQRELPWAYYHSPSAWWTEGERSISGVPENAERLTDTLYAVQFQEPVSNQIYNGPHNTIRTNRIEIDVANWSPRSHVTAEGIVHPKVLTQW